MSIQLTADTDGYYASASVYSVWVIARSGSITSPSTNAFTSTGRVLMTVEGLIASPATAINLFSYAESVPDAPSFITVTETGLVAAMGAYSDGIGFYFAGSELRNAGTVTGNIGVRFGDGQDALVSNDGYILGTTNGVVDSTGIRMTGGAGARILNSGLIEGDAAIDLDGTLGRIDNTGTIRGDSATEAAIDIGSSTAAGQRITLNNDGRIESQDVAITALYAEMKIANTGIILGNVTLSLHDDRFLGQHGRIDGVLDGGNGHDQLRSGNGDDTVLGGGGRDTIRGNDGEDNLDGGTGDDALYGGRDDDVLTGGSGADRLDGGAGDDLCTGGTGADIFVFNRAGGTDRIDDFENGTDRLDLTVFGFSAASEVKALAHDTAAGLFLDLTSLDGGTVLIGGFAKAQFNGADMLL